jgi:hypothetical protein
MSDSAVLTPGLASLRGYSTTTFPLPSSSSAETVIGFPRHIPIRLRAPRSLPGLDQVPVPSWVQPVLDRLTELVALPPDWDTYGALPVARQSVEMALSTLSTVMSEGAELPWIVPLPNGGLQLEWHRVDSDIEIALDPAEPAICIDDEEIPGGVGRWPEALGRIRLLLAAA